MPLGICINPIISLFDEKVHIRIQGLPAETKVTVKASVEHEWKRLPVTFVSCSHFITSLAGEVDLANDTSLGGSYTGVDPMGLFWCLVPDPSGSQNIRLVVKRVEQSLTFVFSVYLGHLSLQELHTSNNPVCMTNVTRTFMAPGVRRLEVRDGRLRGILYLPPGEGPFPGVIDMFGSSGGLMDLRAALLSSHGFAVLALPYFKYEDLPTELGDVDFEYFKEASWWLCNHNAVRNNGIGVIGVSKGGELAQLMGWLFPEVKAVVTINGPPAYTYIDLKWKGRLFKKGIPIDSNLLQIKEGGCSLRDVYNIHPQDFIPVWESGAHVLALVSDDDGQISPHWADEWKKSCPAEKQQLLDVVHYPGAGHLLEPPYTPHCRVCINPSYGINMLWGGSREDHARAQEDSWQRIQDFLRKHLMS
ncbi:acyl-coenzyme A amino acid N-acyltransferase 2-like isoform X2 [Pomacea canaliculata]|nr:acyl-coenzyme A amino acid N-acyltransferase 2-like isoform X2 [Pomacea canaliculata]